MPVPEAPVHEDGRLMLRQDDVGPSGKIFAVQPEAESEGVQNLPNSQFGAGVARPDGPHAGRYPLVVQHARSPNSPHPADSAGRSNSRHARTPAASSPAPRRSTRTSRGS